MKSNFWEEQKMNLDLKQKHNLEISKMGVPEYMLKIKCPNCNYSISPFGIRTIAFKLNSRNIGDVAVEFSCENCNTMDTLYYRSEIENVDDFIKLLKNEKQFKSEPLIEDKMYKKQYNNLLERG